MRLQLEDVEKVNQQMQQRYTSAVREIETKEDAVRQLKARVSEMQVRHAGVTEEVSFLPDSLEQI